MANCIHEYKLIFSPTVDLEYMANFSRLNLISAQSLGASSNKLVVPVPSLISGAEWYPMVHCTAFSQKVLIRADMDTPEGATILTRVKIDAMGRLIYKFFSASHWVYQSGNPRCDEKVYRGYDLSSPTVLKYSADGMKWYGMSPSTKFEYNAVERLPRTQLGTEGYRLVAYPKGSYMYNAVERYMQYNAGGIKLQTSLTATLKYNKYMYSADSKQGTTFPVLQYIAEGKKMPTFEKMFLFYLMQICLWIFILNIEPSVASSWLMVRCFAHCRNQGNLTSFRNGCGRTAWRTTNQGQKVSRCCYTKHLHQIPLR